MLLTHWKKTLLTICNGGDPMVGPIVATTSRPYQAPSFRLLPVRARNHTCEEERWPGSAPELDA